MNRKGYEIFCFGLDKDIGIIIDAIDAALTFGRDNTLITFTSDQSMSFVSNHVDLRQIALKSGVAPIIDGVGDSYVFGYGKLGSVYFLDNSDYPVLEQKARQLMDDSIEHIVLTRKELEECHFIRKIVSQSGEALLHKKGDLYWMERKDDPFGYPEEIYIALSILIRQESLLN